MLYLKGYLVTFLRLNFVSYILSIISEVKKLLLMEYSLDYW